MTSSDLVCGVYIVVLAVVVCRVCRSCSRLLGFLHWTCQGPCSKRRRFLSPDVFLAKNVEMSFRCLISVLLQYCAASWEVRGIHHKSSWRVMQHIPVYIIFYVYILFLRRHTWVCGMHIWQFARGLNFNLKKRTFYRSLPKKKFSCLH